jgi:hypothetical protein
MPDKKTASITWADACRNVVDLEVPHAVVEKIQRGEAAAWYGDAEPRRRSIDEALKEIDDERAGLMARRDQVRSELDALVDAHPELKSAPRRIPPDERGR